MKVRTRGEESSARVGSGLFLHRELPEKVRRSMEDALGGHVDSPIDRGAFAAAVHEIEVSEEDLLGCGEFTNGRYNRFPIARCDAWVVLAMFWKNGRSAIHDHDVSECALRVISGEMEESAFELVEGDLVRAVKTRRLVPGDLVTAGYEAIHQLGTPRGLDCCAISLHAYCPALEAEGMNLYHV